MQPSRHALIVRQLLKIAVAAVAALTVVLVIIYVSLSVRGLAHTASAPTVPLTDEQKLAVLASLKGSGATSTAAEKNVLKNLKTTATTTEEKKLDILKQLHSTQ